MRSPEKADLSVENGSLVMPLTADGVDGDASGPEPAVQQDLGERSPERVPHDDRRLVELIDDRGVVVDDIDGTDVVQGGGVFAQLVDVALHPWPTPAR